MAKKTRTEGYEVAAAYISLYADTQGVSEDINNALGTAAEPAQKAGEEIGEGLAKGSKEKTKGLGQRLLAWGGFAAIGSLVGGLFKDGWDTATAQLDLERTLSANLGVTPQVAAEYADVAADLYAQGWGESLEEVGASVQSMLSEVGHLSRSELEELAPLLMGIAEQTGADMARLADATNKLTVTGLAGSVTEAADIIAKAYQSFGESSGEDILDTITEYSGQFQKLGIDAETAMGMVKQAMDAGARNTDFVADALKEFSIRSVDGSKASIAAYEALGLSGEEMTRRLAEGGPDAALGMQEVFDAINGVGDAATREQIAVALFGTKAEDLGAALESMNPRTAAEGFGEFAGTAQEMADASMSLDDMLAGLSRTLSGAIADTLRPILPQLREFLQIVTGVFGWLRDNPVVTTILLAIGAAIAVMAAAQWAFNIAMLANPIVLWVTAALVVIGLLVAGFVWLVQNWDGVVAGFQNGANQIQAALLPALENTKFGLDTFIGAAQNGASQIGGWFGGVFSSIGAWGADTWTGLTTGIQNALQYIVELAMWASNEVNKAMGGKGGLKAPKIPAAGKIPGMKDGGKVTGSGLSWVGEEGPELMHFSPGATIIPNDVSMDLANGAGSGGRGTQVTIVNPVAEKSSQSLSRYRRDIGADIALA
ncbi:phage tail tape measure protein [Microbacterium sp. HA-8]|uniref:phage tail tape measure protein n=1 Tax=Microbacterium sp. HA-8 TaxID=3234200 RepID=UPI0038F70DCA